MFISKLPQTSLGRVSLTVRVSFLLVLAVVIPLLITVGGSELFLRPTLLAQAATEMENDAQTHVQSFDAYLIARIQDVSFLGTYLGIQKFLAGDQTFRDQALKELAVGDRLDPNFTTWTLFDTQGNLHLSFPILPGLRGKFLIEPGVLPLLNGKNKVHISDVYFDDATNEALVDIYSSITGADGTLLGFGRATLKLDQIWTAVNNETNAGPGNYAVILDGHGVRIAYTNPDVTLTTTPVGLFKAVAPLSPQFQQRLEDENLYGNAHAPVKTLFDPTMADILQNTQGSTTVQGTPALQNEAFQISRANSQILPWTYLVLRPVSTITKAADQQERYLFLIAALVSVLAVLVGLIVGRSITRPILRSVTSLLGSSEALKELAGHEQTTANEQKWMIEASQNGLHSVEYYTEATRVAARKLNEVGVDLRQNWENIQIQKTRQRLSEIIAAAQYIEKAVAHQHKSSKSLAVAVRVTTEVTEQLITGATSATEAATQLDRVVEQLRKVVGK